MVLRFSGIWSLLPLSSLISHTSAPTFSTSTINGEFAVLWSHTSFRLLRVALVGTFFTLLHLAGSPFRFSLDSNSSSNPSIRLQSQIMLYVAYHIPSHMALKLVCLSLLSLLPVSSLRPGCLLILFPFSISSI